MAAENDSLLTEINGKPIIASGEFITYYNEKGVDQVFGVIVNKDNTVLKFRIIVNVHDYAIDDYNEGCDYDLKLIYLGDDPIDCSISIFA